MTYPDYKGDVGMVRDVIELAERDDDEDKLEKKNAENSDYEFVGQG